MSTDTNSVLPDSTIHHVRTSSTVEGREGGNVVASTASVKSFHSAREVSDHIQSQSSASHLPPRPSSPAVGAFQSSPRSDSMPSLVPAPPLTLAIPMNSRATPNASNAVAEPTSADPPVLARQSWPRRMLAFFGCGHGNRARKQLLSIIWTTFIDGGELIAILVLLPLSVHLTSPTAAPLNEWDACSKPLGVWNAVWTVHAVFDLLLAYSSWTRQRRKRMHPASAEEAPAPEMTDATDATSQNTRRRSAPSTDGDASATQSGQDRSSGTRSRGYPQWQARLSAFITFFTVVWFVLAHILLYTSTNSCRLSSPHIWWLTFAILCVMYISVVEVIFIGVMVFIVLPLVTLGFHIALLILGRHPALNPNQINPSIDKLPKKLVDLIPLVVFIPPPPDEHETHTITLPAPTLSYPPLPKPAPIQAKRPRFRFLRRKTKAAVAANDNTGDAEKGVDDADVVHTWEDRWEAGKYPFVRLEENRATCAICMEDFEAPRPKDSANDSSHSEAISSEAARSPTVEDPSAIRLEDAGEGAQPLRLLVCGHVFHQLCLDPWLTGVSGRCPTCQRPVEFTPEQLDQASRGSRRSRRRT